MGTSKEPVRLALRKLWSDHVIWTRQYIVAAVAETPDAGPRQVACSRTRRTSARRSCRYYGDGAGDRLTELLKEHIMIAVDLVAAAKSGDQAAFAQHDARWTANIEEIARSSPAPTRTGPRRTSSTCSPLHLKLTKDEAVARITVTGPPTSRRSTTSSTRSWSSPTRSTTGSSPSSRNGSAPRRWHDPA